MIGAKRARLWVNAGLAIMVVALAVWAYLAQQDTGEQADPLTTVARSEVERIVLRPVVGEAIEITRAEHGWNVVAPIRAPADQTTVDSLLDILDAAALSRYPERSLKLSEVGLAPPQLWLDFSGARIALGAVNPLNLRRYVMYEGRVALTQDRYSAFLDAAPIDYASRSPVPHPARLIRLEVPDYHLERDDAGQWQQSDEIKDPQAAEALVDAWKQAEAVALSQTAETEALSQAVLGFEGGEEIQLLVIARDPELVLARADLGLAYHFDVEAADHLFPPAPVLPESETESDPDPDPDSDSADEKVSAPLSPESHEQNNPQPEDDPAGDEQEAEKVDTRRTDETPGASDTRQGSN